MTQLPSTREHAVEQRGLCAMLLERAWCAPEASSAATAAVMPSMARRQLILSGAPSNAMISVHAQWCRLICQLDARSDTVPPGSTVYPGAIQLPGGQRGMGTLAKDGESAGATAAWAELGADASRTPVSTAVLHCKPCLQVMVTGLQMVSGPTYMSGRSAPLTR